MQLLKIWLFVQEGLIPCKSIKIISLITNLSFALREKKKMGFWKHIHGDWGRKRIGKYWIFLWKEQMGQSDIRLQENYDKVRPKEEEMWKMRKALS